MLVEFGYTVIAADGGDAGLELLRYHPEVAVLVIDVELEDGPYGCIVAERGRKERPGLPVLLTSGSEAPPCSDDAMLVPDMDVILKPFTAAPLRGRLAAVMGKGSQPSGIWGRVDLVGCPASRSPDVRALAGRGTNAGQWRRNRIAPRVADQGSVGSYQSMASATSCAPSQIIATAT